MKTLKKNKFIVNGFYILIMLLFLALATFIGHIFRRIGFPETTVVLSYLLGVVLTARFASGFLYGLLSSVLSIFAYNFFFTEPYHSFKVNDPSYIVTIIIMMVTALLTSTLTYQVKKNALEAKKKEAETKALYVLTSHLTDAADSHDIASIATKIISNVMECNSACICFNENGQPENTYIEHSFNGTKTIRETLDIETILSKTESPQSGRYTDSEFCNWIIYGRDSILGMIRIPSENACEMTDAQIKLIDTMTESIALAMDRIIVAKQRVKYREESMQEHYRGNLLRAISHDLRTPLSGIMGTSEMILDMSEKSDPRFELAGQIHGDAVWLHSLVENILSLTKLQDGKLMLNKQAEAVEEVIGSAVGQVAKRFPEYDVTVSIPNDLFLVPMDAKLIEQVLINLLDNAIKHSTPSDEISVSVCSDESKSFAVFTVIDSGEGIAESDMPNIFKMFYTVGAVRADVQHGVGLGLSICDAIVKAHGGTIDASNRTDQKGAKFVFTLPLEDEK